MVHTMSFLIFAFWILHITCNKRDSLKVNHSLHCADPSSASNLEGDLIIGGFFPVHIVKPTQGTQQSYDINLYGLNWVEAMLFTIQEINQNHNFLPRNFTLGYDIRDSCNSVPVALNAALDFMLEAGNTSNGNNPIEPANNCSTLYCKCKSKQTLISAVIGAASSSISVSVASLVGVDYTPQISYSSTSVLLSDKTIYPSFFRTIPSDTYQAQALADLLLHFGWTYVSIVASDNAYGRAGVDSLRTELKKRRICIALEKIFNPSLSKEELQTVIEHLKNTPKARVIILWCERPNAVGFLNEASRQQLNGKTWIGTETWGDAYQLKRLDENVVGGMLGVLPLLKKHLDYEKHLRELRPNSTAYNPWMWEYWEGKFDCFMKDSKNQWPSSIRKIQERDYYVYSTERPNVTILCPRQSSLGRPSGQFLPRNKYTNVMDAVYAVAHAIKDIFNCKNTESGLQGEECPTVNGSFVRPRDISRFLKNVSFKGRSGSQIMFDRNGDLRYGSYAIKNLQRVNDTEMEFVEIGVWNGIDGKLSLLNTSRIIWNGWTSEKPKSICADPCAPGYYSVQGSISCCWKCVKCENGFAKSNSGPEVCRKCPVGFASNAPRTHCVELKSDYLAWQNGHGITTVVLAIIGLIISHGVLVVFYRYRDTAMVKASNRELSFLHLGCIVAVFVLPFVLIGMPTEARCTVRPLFFGIPFTLCTSITLLKTDRLLRIFQARTRLAAGSSYLISNKMQVILASMMTLVPVTVTTVWFAFHAPEVITKVDLSREGWQVVSCGASNELLNIVILAYVLILALLCTYFAFRARKLPENFNEAKYICFAMFAFCVFWLSFFPAYYDSVGSKRDFIFCVAVLGSGYAVLCIMYSPKLHVILFRPENNTTEAFRAITLVAMKRTGGVVVSSNSTTPPRATPVSSPLPSRRESPADGFTVINGRLSAVSIGQRISPSPK
ncbi:extracellular calcium-sensing receptor-like [Acropora millepora]|uniref:extracellular calcium-sensing receptor-like n=1 Tax=Acropora millepora TaxID=45264 RepID=UPI001CF2BC9F|nr:extracellular calcium-sensing receptor-like [Acropora millepora]